MLYVITLDSASLGLYPSAVLACVHFNNNNNIIWFNVIWFGRRHNNTLDCMATEAYHNYAVALQQLAAIFLPHAIAQGVYKAS